MASLIATPSISLSSDTGISATDKITKNGAITISGLLTGATAQYSTNGGASWVNSFNPVEGYNSVQVRQIDSRGKISAASSALKFTLDRVAAAAPTLTLSQDSGSSAVDKITNQGSLLTSGLESGAKLEYSINGGATWSASFSAVQGLNSVQARQTDVAGNVSAVSSLSFTLDTVVAAPALKLANDTGISGIDKLTSNAALNIVGVEAGAALQYSTDGGAHWSSSFTAREGDNAVQVRQIDAAGNVSASSASLVFTHDTYAATPTLSLSADSGASATDKVTNNTNLSVAAWEARAWLEYSTDGGVNWTSTFKAVEGVNSVQARQTDAAGNVSAASASFVFTRDTVAATPTLSLAADSGASSTDKITNNGKLSVAGGENGAEILFTTDGGLNWASIFTAVEGANSVQTKQIDAAGNVSATSSALVFTFDTKAPLAPTLALTTDSGSSNTDYLTNVAALTVNGVEYGNKLEYSTDNGAHWLSSFTAAEGNNTVQVRQIDTAGNVSSASAALSFTLDTVAPATVLNQISFSNDTGLSQTDFITQTAAQSISAALSEGLAAGDVVQASLEWNYFAYINDTNFYDPASYWTDISANVNGTALKWNGVSLLDSSTMQIRVTDLAGNFSGPALADYRVDTTAPSAIVNSATITVGENITGFQSTEAGVAFLVNNAMTVTDLASLNGFVASGMASELPMLCPVLPNSYSSSGINPGSYHLFTVDIAGNVSAASAGEVTIVGLTPQIFAAFV